MSVPKIGTDFFFLVVYSCQKSAWIHIFELTRKYATWQQNVCTEIESLPEMVLQQTVFGCVDME